MPRGKKLLNENGIPDVFPCVIENAEKNYYYFCGDFCDTPVYLESAKFMGISFLHKFFYEQVQLRRQEPPSSGIISDQWLPISWMNITINWTGRGHWRRELFRKSTNTLWQ